MENFVQISLMADHILELPKLGECNKYIQKFKKLILSRLATVMFRGSPCICFDYNRLFYYTTY